MKTHIITLAAVSLALSTGTVFAKSETETPARMYQAEYVDLEYGPTIDEGMAELPVQNALGRPTLKIAPGIWVYCCDFAPKDNRANADGCTELVVVFTKGRVSSIYFANEKARKVLQARNDRGATRSDVILATVPMQTEGLVAQK